MTTRYPVAYLRRSYADADDTGDVSREAQLNAVRELARRDKHNGDVRIFEDWDRSADEAKEARRTKFRAMLRAVEAGQVSVIYAFSLDRLARSTTTFAKLLAAAKANNVRVVTQREGDLSDTGNPMTWAFGFLVAFFAEFELRVSKARNQRARDVQRGRGDHMGRVGYGFRFAKEPGGRLVRTRENGTIVEPDPERPLGPVLAAVRETNGNILGACKLLNERGVPPPQGPARERRNKGAEWHPTPLRRIVERNAPELLKPRNATGRRPTRAPSMRLAQLLVCPCGGVMTPHPGRAGYRCARGSRIGLAAHGPSWVSEGAILPAIMAEADRLDPGFTGIEHSVAADAERQTALLARRARVVDAFVEGLLDKERRDRELAAIAAELDTMEAVEQVESIEPVIWDAPPEHVNAQLRAIWSRVHLGPDMMPVAFTWRVPEWRRAP